MVDEKAQVRVAATKSFEKKGSFEFVQSADLNLLMIPGGP